jgi:hypothetical protein
MPQPKIYPHIIPAILAAYTILSSTALANQPPPPDAKGRFYNIDWPTWRVVDRDPRGLNCRRGPGINNSVVARLRLMTLLTPVTPRRLEVDKDGDPWMEVRLSNGGSCFISANTWYVMPSWEEQGRR